ncbi:MAG: site-specific integrase [Planctomycetota bacterium]|jgi:hypothetical protein
MKNVKERMIEDMKLRGLTPRTQGRYLHTIKALAEHYHRRPGQITEKQVRKYLLYLIESKGYAKSTFNIDDTVTPGHRANVTQGVIFSPVVHHDAQVGRVNNSVAVKVNNRNDGRLPNIVHELP